MPARPRLHALRLSRDFFHTCNSLWGLLIPRGTLRPPVQHQMKPLCAQRSKKQNIFSLKDGWSKFNFTGLYQNVLRSQGAEEELEKHCTGMWCDKNSVGETEIKGEE